MHGFVVAGTNSGCGKTTITIGLMALLKSMGKRVAPFKTGPDYIDPLFHTQVVGTPSYNLDGYMLTEPTLNHLYAKHADGADVVVVEGVMGMYDGMGEMAVGSSYELAKTLNLPVVLVVSCKSLYQSVAAIVKGFATLEADANVIAVILNHVPSDDYYQFLKSVIERQCQIACVGYLPRDPFFTIESRHLGLIQAEEIGELELKVEKLKTVMAQTIDIERLLSLSEVATMASKEITLPNLRLDDLHIGVASDKAFRFYYKDNLELLEELGATLHYFSPLEDVEIPVSCTCLYLGGGYPEVFATQLSANISMLSSIKQAALKGLPIYAECGGLMYLSESIISLEGQNYPMCGVLSASVKMTTQLQRFGYAQVCYNGTQSRCHEFHRSMIVEKDKTNYTMEFQLSKPEKQKEWRCGLKQQNVLAAYAHIHFYSDFQFFEQIVKLWKQATM